MARYIVPLKKRASEESLVGGKAASVSWLLRNRFRVPDGFVITVQGFRDFLAEFGITSLSQQRSWSEQDLEYIREMLTACRIPDRIVSEIATAYGRLGGSVAVRSSMIGEDTASATFAGQLDTYLNRTGVDAVLTAVRQCWASAFNWRLASYLQERNADLSEALVNEFAVAVIVQRMIVAQAAGVAFSADPITGEKCVQIEAVHGLGDALVQGVSEPDRYSVDIGHTLCSYTAVAENDPALSQQQALELAQIVTAVSQNAQMPLDIEWAWDGKSFFLLQSRPITSLVGKHIYSNSMVGEMLPGLIKPLVWSVSTQSKLRDVMGRIFTEIIGPSDIDYGSLAKRIHSRIYADNTMLADLLERMGFPANFFEVMSHNERASTHPRPPINLRTVRTMLRTVRFVWRHARLEEELNTYLEHHDTELGQFRGVDWSSADESVLLGRADDLIKLYSETMWYNFVGPLNMMVRKRLLDTMVERWVPKVSSADLVKGLVGLKSLDSSRDLQQISEQARELGPEICEQLTERSCKEIESLLSTSGLGQSLLTSVDAFLDKYGFLSAVGTDLSRTPWIENPIAIWHSIGRAALRQSIVDQHDHQILRNQTETQARAKLSPLHRFAFDRLLRTTTIYMHLRERSSFMLSEESFELRRIFLALGDSLVSRQELGHREDIFYLWLDELRRLATGEMEGSIARELVASRRKEMEDDALLDLPDTVCGDNVVACPVEALTSQQQLLGIGGSSGWAEGQACIVLDPVTAPARLSERDILVVPFSDVSWTPLFAGIGGIVAETGGQLSHSAIVAREYGLPAVVNVKNATRLIQDGQTIIVDGNRGQVYLR